MRRGQYFGGQGNGGIDPVPFQLEVNQRKAQVDEAAAQLQVALEELSSAKAALAASTSSACSTFIHVCGISTKATLRL
mgnify:CR=1 FL=1